jgi:hypothetical protein
MSNREPDLSQCADTFLEQRNELWRMVQRFLDLPELGLSPLLPTTEDAIADARVLLDTLRRDDWRLSVRVGMQADRDAAPQ